MSASPPPAVADGRWVVLAARVVVLVRDIRPLLEMVVAEKGKLNYELFHLINMVRCFRKVRVKLVFNVYKF